MGRAARCSGEGELVEVNILNVRLLQRCVDTVAGDRKQSVLEPDVTDALCRCWRAG